MELRDCPSEVKVRSEQSTHGPQNFQQEERSTVATKLGSIQGPPTKSFTKHNFGVFTKAYVMKVKEDADLPEAILMLDWLIKHNVVVDCRAKGVCLITAEGK
ncbi:Retrotransposon-like protein [Gossypium australe]|uniref:Retrotransposon-like protein n=1 Tax=Gossypium australe TaxID=47621 RepID=A0A5B6WRQ4_9ROSI|nr:Retrotransposon-like protein [Gossypium australe]